MTEAAFQILLLLGYLAIGLLSVTFPIYALCITYLRQEYLEYKQEKKRRINELKRTIDRLNKELSGEPKDSDRFKEIKGQIKSYAGERWKTRFQQMTTVGAVVAPVTLLFIALALACGGIYSFYEDDSYWVVNFAIGSSVFSGGAVFILCRTLSSVQQAALRPGRTLAVDVCYEKQDEKTKKVKLEKATPTSVSVCPLEENLDDLVVNIHVPPDIEVSETFGLLITKQPDTFKHPHYNMISAMVNFAPRFTYQATRFTVTGKKVGNYKIYVEIDARGAHRYSEELDLEVVE